jgi:broad specificity phosphatase PhoE
MALGPFYVAEKLKRPEAARGVAILMRHGETAWNRQGRVMGRSSVELDEGGRAQVEASVPFARLLKLDLIVTSPLDRARQSAEIVAAGVGGIHVAQDSQLEEVRYGRWEGMTFDQLEKDKDYIEYREAPLRIATPGGETISEVQDRAVAAIGRAIAGHPGKRILFVSHGDIIRTALAHFLKVELEHFRRIRVDNAAFSAIQISGDFAEVKFVNLLPDPGRAFVTPF